MNDKSALYYEAHITIDPVFGDKLVEVEEVSRYYNFKVASLMMQKRKEDTPERSKYDTFTTGHSVSYADLTKRVIGLIVELQMRGFVVRRYKVEDTMYDSKREDILGLLK